MYDLVIIGAGAVGLGIGRYFQVEKGWRCLIVEREAQHGLGISSRNSEVIHAGLYYRANSLKARLCVDGKDRLYHYLEQNDLPHRRTGKYVLALPEAERRLTDLHASAVANGVDDVTLLERGQVRSIYPQLAPHAALFSPSTGIVSADGLMHHLLREYQAAGGDLALNTTFAGMDKVADDYRLDLLDAQGDTVSVETTRVINSAGLGALDVATAAGFEYDRQGYELRHCKGSYFRVPGGRGLFNHLIYPLPSDVSLGIHLNIDLQSQLRLGPNQEYTPPDAPNYTVDIARAEDFREAVSTYWPGIVDMQIEPDWAGIRPHLYKDGKFVDDFHIRDEVEAGCPGWVNLLGIESPGLTACLAFGPYIAKIWAEVR